MGLEYYGAEIQTHIPLFSIDHVSLSIDVFQTRFRFLFSYVIDNMQIVALLSCINLH